jgi:hypothetical protein
MGRINVTSVIFEEPLGLQPSMWLSQIQIVCLTAVMLRPAASRAELYRQGDWLARSGLVAVPFTCFHSSAG